MNKKAKNNWKDTGNKSLAFLDIMGFKEFVTRNTQDYVYQRLIKLRPTIDVIKSIESDEDTEINSNVKVVTFSDSIILTSNDASIDTAKNLIFYVAFIIGEAIKIGIPIKGAIAYGEQTADFTNDIHFGKPLIDSYELQEELFLYGAVLHHTMEKFLIDETNINTLISAGFLIKYLTPMKTGKINHYLVDWIFPEDKPSDSVQKIYNNVSGHARAYVDNTLEFIQSATRQKKQGSTQIEA